LSREVICDFGLYQKRGQKVLNRVESTAFLRETTVVYTNEYPFTLPMVGIGQLARLNASCLPIDV